MKQTQNILADTFGRTHNYLRISLTERCNLRCSYCMPMDGVPLTPKPHLMTGEELFEIAKLFVDAGVNKIRLTGGEPLIRKDFPEILTHLSTLPVSLSITSNGVNIDRHIAILKSHHVSTINLSLDTLDAIKFKKITFRDYFEKVYANIFKLIDAGFKIKINVVLMKGINDNEINDFIEFTKNHPVNVRFIEFMPFDGNNWNREKTVSLKDILHRLDTAFAKAEILRLPDAPNDTAKNYKIAGYTGEFGIISTVTNPFCDSCNRIRLTANGQLKNCLFSTTESDLLTPFREGKDIKPIIQKAVLGKHAMRGGLSTPEQFNDPKEHSDNRSMIRIGG
ncbi:GTP 3',8-cyclase MoaA [uncultured Dokdonia sp.]|uniref:GTP 3',8-cyclase MoaA n=1 Tax=uncultured Dokdonia sp. TaxID=575653 RepID=UPI002619466F|nr:GTP 3',8-cyclase MoaA [uncultured Dokdonia sp.]